MLLVTPRTLSCAPFRVPPNRLQTDSEAAGNIKRQLEAQFGGLWHVILGQSYGCSVAHEAGMIVSFRIGRTAVTAFSSFDESQLVRPKKAHIKLAAGQPGAAGTGAAPDEDAEDAGAQ